MSRLYVSERIDDCEASVCPTEPVYARPLRAGPMKMFVPNSPRISRPSQLRGIVLVSCGLRLLLTL